MHRVGIHTLHIGFQEFYFLALDMDTIPSSVIFSGELVLDSLLCPHPTSTIYNQEKKIPLLSLRERGHLVLIGIRSVYSKFI